MLHCKHITTLTFDESGQVNWTGGQTYDLVLCVDCGSLIVKFPKS